MFFEMAKNRACQGTFVPKDIGKAVTGNKGDYFPLPRMHACIMNPLGKIIVLS